MGRPSCAQSGRASLNVCLLAAVLQAFIACCVAQVQLVELTVDSPEQSFAESSALPHFVVGIAGGTPPEEPRGRLLVMSDVNGTRYTCYLPEDAVDAMPESTPRLVAEQELGAAKTPEALLDGLNGLCAYRNEGWWTHEVCYKKSARQYHVHDEQISDQYLLGNFTAGAANTNEVLTDSSVVGGAVRYVRQMYTGGDECEITGERRSVEVRYLCSPGGGKTELTSVSEPRSCSYVFTVATPRLCKHHLFLSEPTPVVPIGCYPLDAGGSGRSHTRGSSGGDGEQGAVCSAESGTCSAAGQEEAAAAGEEHMDQGSANMAAHSTNSSTSVDGEVPEDDEDVDGVVLNDLLGGDDGYYDYYE